MNSFEDKIKELSNLELFKAIELRDEYQKEAIEAIELEISQRNLTSKEIQEIKDEIKIEEKKSKENNLVNKSISFLKKYHPKSKWDSQIRSNLILFTAILYFVVYYIIKQTSLLIYIFKEGDIDISVIEFILPFIVIPISIVLFFQKKKNGWIMMTLSFLYLSIAGVMSLLFEIKWNIKDYEEFGVPIAYSIYFFLLIRLSISLFILKLINHKTITQLFNINKTTKYSLFISVSIITLMIWGKLFV